MPPKKTKKKRNKRTALARLDSVKLHEVKQHEHNIEIEETKYAIESVSCCTGDYSHYALNFIISSYVADCPKIKFIEIGHGLPYIRQALEEFKESERQTKAIMPIRPTDSEGKEIQHFTGLYIEKAKKQNIKVFYIDPLGNGNLQGISSYKNVISEIFSDLYPITVRNKIQHSESVNGIKVASNRHCGAFIVEILTGLALEDMRIEDHRLKQKKGTKWQKNLDESRSDQEGIKLRKKHLKLLQGTEDEQKSILENDSSFFPRCEYYSRFKDTTYFNMNDAQYWRTYFRSTTRGGGCDRYATELKDSSKIYGNSIINTKSDTGHASNGTFVSPFFHEKYKKIVKPQNFNPSIRESSKFLYDKILKYKQGLCKSLIKEINHLKLRNKLCKVKAIYANEYPCIMISIEGISKSEGKNSIDSWYKMIMSYYVAIVNSISMKTGIAIELVLRSSFGHNLPSVDSTEESFRISMGIIPKKYLKTLAKGLKILNSVIQTLEGYNISKDALRSFNCKITKYNQKERLPEKDKIPQWNKSLFATLNLRAVKRKSKEHINVIHEIVARGRNYPDLLVDLIIKELEREKVNYAAPLLEMLNMLDYSGKSVTLKIEDGDYYKFQKEKLAFQRVVKVDDSRFWNLLEEISQSLHNLKLAKQVKSKQLQGIYSTLEEANLAFIKNSGYQEAEDGIGSDSDCEAVLDIPKKPPTPTPVYARKIITVTGMRAINVAAFLAFQNTIRVLEEGNKFGSNFKDMYYETEKALKNVCNTMADWFGIIKRNSSKKADKILFFDLNKCVVQEIIPKDDDKASLEKHLTEVNKDFLVILDYTSATTDTILEAIKICLQKVHTVLLVNSGLKNEQMSSDTNPYGTLRIVSTDHSEMLDLYP